MSTRKSTTSPPKTPRRSPRRKQSSRKKEETPTASKARYDSDSASENGHGTIPDTQLFNDEFLESLTDTIEYYAERMLIEKREDRMTIFETFNSYWEMHPMKKYTFGSLHARRLLCNCIFAICIEDPYPNLTDESDADENRMIKAMISWNRNNWTGVETELLSLRNLAIRKDTKNVFNFHLDDTGIQKLCNPEDIDKKLETNMLFSKRAERLQKRFIIQKAIAPIRETLEKAIATHSQPAISQDDIDDIFEFLKNTRREDVDDAVLNLFDEESLSDKPKFKTWKELKKVLQNKYFSLTLLQDMAERLLQQWNRIIFGELPILIKMKYRLTDGDSMSDTSVNIASATPGQPLQALKRKREILGKYHGDDPLEESIRIGTQARKVYVREEVTVKKDVDSAQEHDREDNHEAENELKEHKPVELSVLPPRRKMYVKVYGGVKPDEDVFTADGRVKKRRPWTERETGALAKGVAKYGKGSWADIKEEYAEILRNRTTVQLKDKWRNMEKNGEDKEVEG